MALTVEQANEVFSMLLAEGLHNRDADEAYRKDFALQLTGDLFFAKYCYRNSNGKAVVAYFESDFSGMSIRIHPESIPTAEEELAYQSLNRKIADYLGSI